MFLHLSFPFSSASESGNTLVSQTELNQSAIKKCKNHRDDFDIDDKICLFIHFLVLFPGN